MALELDSYPAESDSTLTYPDVGTLKRILENNDTKWGRFFDLIIQTLIVLSLITFSVETLPDLSDPARRWLRYIEVVTVTIFTGEYILLRLLFC